MTNKEVERRMEKNKNTSAERLYSLFSSVLIPCSSLTGFHTVLPAKLFKKETGYTPTEFREFPKVKTASQKKLTFSNLALQNHYKKEIQL
jgi:hypothetical protein